jgi:hypothetical protein
VNRGTDAEYHIRPQYTRGAIQPSRKVAPQSPGSGCASALRTPRSPRCPVRRCD